MFLLVQKKLQIPRIKTPSDQNKRKSKLIKQKKKSKKNIDGKTVNNKKKNSYTQFSMS